MEDDALIRKAAPLHYEPASRRVVQRDCFIRHVEGEESLRFFTPLRLRSE